MRVAYSVLLALIVGCGNHDSTPTATGELTVTSTASIAGRLTSPTGAAMTGASMLLLAIQAPTTNPSVVPVLYDAPGTNVDQAGHFLLTIRRRGEPTPVRTPDTLSAQLITRAPSGSVQSQVDTVLLVFTRVGTPSNPRRFDVQWRGRLP